MLVIDASTSMTEPTGHGRTKLTAAVGAAGVFLDQLRLDVGDQAAIVAFNADAYVLERLTADRSRLDAALSRIAPAEKTRIHLAIGAAHAELVGPRRHTGNVPVMIVLTDGRANPDPVVLAVERAADAKADGVVLFTVGLGDDLDEAALRQMASTPGAYFHAPSAEDLASIYRRIAVDIPCPAEQYWGRR